LAYSLVQTDARGKKKGKCVASSVGTARGARAINRQEGGSPVIQTRKKAEKKKMTSAKSPSSKKRRKKKNEERERSISESVLKEGRVGGGK